MLGYVSQEAMAASSLANQIQLILFMTFNGIIAGASVMGSQYWGKKDRNTIERVMGLAMRFSLALAVIFFLAVECFPAGIMRLFTNEEAIIREGITYLRIIGFSYLFIGFTQVYLSVQRSVERVRLPSVTYIVSLLTNVTLNACFIFGLLGMPRLGLAGVALGTVIARFCETMICAVHSHLKTTDIHFRIRFVFTPSGVLMRDFLGLSIPSVINDAAWSLAASMYSVILGHLGGDAVAANAVAVMARNIGAVVARGFANATTIIIGKTLGENNLPATRVYAKRMTSLSSLFGALGGLLIILLRPLILYIYTDRLTAAAYSYLSVFLFMESFHVWGEAINTCWICGCFRGGGDSRFGMIVDTLSMWLIAVPLMAIAAFVLHLPVSGVYFFLCLDEFEKMLPCYLHYRKFTWLRNITRDSSEIS